MPDTLLESIKRKLPPAHEREALEAVATGSGVPFHTLLKIVTGETEDPRSSTLQMLVDYYDKVAA